MQLKSYRRRMGLKIGRLMIKSGGLTSLLLDILRQLKYQVFLAIFGNISEFCSVVSGGEDFQSCYVKFSIFKLSLLFLVHHLNRL